MEAVYGWIRNIVCYLCLFNIFLQALPGENFKKYVRFFGGLLLIVMVLGPLADMANLSESFEQAWRLGSLREQAEDMRITGQGSEELREDKINEAYRKELKRQVEDVVRAYGMEPVKVELQFSENAEGIRGISGADLQISGGEEDFEKKASDIKNELLEVYHISAGHINISIQE